MSRASNEVAGEEGGGNDGRGNQPQGGASLRYGNPWDDSSSARDPLRRLRGHLVLPVTIWLAGNVDEGPSPTGLTVSSVLISQGEPPFLAGLVTPTSDLADMLGGQQLITRAAARGRGRQAPMPHHLGEALRLVVAD